MHPKRIGDYFVSNTMRNFGAKWHKKYVGKYLMLFHLPFVSYILNTKWLKY
jgi:hypothetical protein